MSTENATTHPHTRRAFVGGAAAAGMGALASPYLPEAGAAKSKRKRRRRVERRRVDMHSHYLAPEYLTALRAAGRGTIGGIPVPAWTPEIALEMQDDYGIAFQMLSVSDPGVSFLSGSAATSLARSCNEYVAGVVRANPRRFGALTVVPLPDVSAALAEVRQGLDTLKHDGVGLLSSYGGRYLGDPAFEPLLAELNRRRTWVFVHPTAVGADDKPALSLPDFTFEYPFDTTRTIMSLLFNGSFQRYPNIRWQFAHGGGTIAMLRFRLHALGDGAKSFGAILGLPPGSKVSTGAGVDRALAKSYYDTALIADRPSLAAVRNMTSIRHLVFGSDFPFANSLTLLPPGPLYPSPKKLDWQPSLAKAFNDRDLVAINRLNARRQFPRVARIVRG